MNPHQIRRYLIDNGFEEGRRVRHGHFWSDGQSYVMVSRKPINGDPCAVRNLIAEIDRAVKRRQESPLTLLKEDPVKSYDAKDLSAMQRSEDNQRRTTALTASLGAVAELNMRAATEKQSMNGHTPPQKPVRTRRAFKDAELAKIERRIQELLNARHPTKTILHLLTAEGFKYPTGEPFELDFIWRAIRRIGTAGDSIPSPATAPVVLAPTPKPIQVTRPNELPDAVAWILLDGKLTDGQKVGMIKAWAGV